MDSLEYGDRQFQKLLSKLACLAIQRFPPDIMSKGGDTEHLLAASQAARITELERQLGIATQKVRTLQDENQGLQTQVRVQGEPCHSEQILIELREHLSGCRQDISRLHSDLADRTYGDSWRHSQILGNRTEIEQLKAWLCQLVGQQRAESVNLQNQMASLRAEVGQQGCHIKGDVLGGQRPTLHPTCVGPDAHSMPRV